MFGKELSLICLLVGCGHGLFLDISEEEKRCFVQELPDFTTVIISYKLELYNNTLKEFETSAPGYEMHIEVKSPTDKFIISKFYEPKGNIQFAAYSPGDHRICIYAKSTSFNWLNFKTAQFRLHLDIKVGERTIDYNKAANKGKFTELQLRVYQLLEQVEQIQKEYNYQRYREQIFRDSCASTKRYIIYCVLVQSALLILLGLWKENSFKVRQTTKMIFRVLIVIFIK